MLELLLALALSAAPLQLPEEDDADPALDDPFGVISHTIEEKELQGGLAGRAGARRGPLDYQYSTPTRKELGEFTHVAVESGTVVPSHGYYPLRASIDNSAGPAQRLSLSYESNSGGRRAIRRTVELQAGERRTVILPVPVELRFGNLRAAGPGIGKLNTTDVFFTPAYRPQTSVLALGNAADFERFVGKPRAPGGNAYDRQERAQVQLMLPGEAPTELASFVGYDAVVVPGALFDTLPEGLRRALEAYAASGGTLVLEKQPRDLALFPLLDGSSSPAGRTPYGFGVVGFSLPGELVQAEVRERAARVSPTGKREAWERTGSGDSLLPQATAPLGRFLVIIGLFTLAIGPGSILVARRRGSAALLLTIPLTAFVTCAVIIGTSLVGDGFKVHAHFEGYTLLDGASHRAVTVGLGAYYANLAPGRTRFGAGVVPLPPSRADDGQSVGFDWDDGVTIPFDFLPSRSYREWGFLAVEPSRARLGLTAAGGAPTVQNALGAQILELRLRWKGRDWTVAALDDGAAAAAVALAPTASALAAEDSFKLRGADRFAAEVPARLVQPLGEGEFLARVRGEGFTPLGGLTLEQHESQHLIRGTVSP